MSQPSVSLVKKLIAVLEAVERLPLYCYDSPGSTLNLQVIIHYIIPLIHICFQVLQRRLHFKIERASTALSLKDISGRTLRVEPLVTVDGLEKFLNGRV